MLQLYSVIRVPNCEIKCSALFYDPVGPDILLSNAYSVQQIDHASMPL